MNGILIGSQWGDEGKGKIVDILAEEFNIIVRFQGGNNAGHTVIVDGKKYALHLLPSGVIRGKTGVIGQGCVVNPDILLKEITELQPEKLFVDGGAHAILFYHEIADKLKEIQATTKIGTTGRGIGPAYADKINRKAIRMEDLTKQALQEKLPEKLEEYKRIIIATIGEEKLKQIMQEQYAQFYNEQTIFDQEKIIQYYAEQGEKIKPHLLDDAGQFLYEQSKENSILFEGAQGTMLSVNDGTYPFVTSSDASYGGAITGSGVHLKPDRIIAIVKAYTTRVGRGPLPTELCNEQALQEELKQEMEKQGSKAKLQLTEQDQELFNQTPNDELLGKYLVVKGAEYGTTTGRIRRTGWIDLVQLKKSIRVNGFTELVITKLDVLDNLKEIKICTSYKYNDQTITSFPKNNHILEKCTPVYETMPGWQTSIEECKNYDDLPENAKKYLQKLEQELGVPISIVSVGPDRNQTIIKK